MSPHRLRLRLLIAAVAAALTLGTVPAAPASAASSSYVTLGGDGSSWAQPAIQQWAHDVSNQGIQINYTGDGSAQGREKYIEDQNDFAGSDIAFLTQGDPFGGGIETPTWNYSYIPIVAGGTTFIYNLSVGGRKVTNLRLSGQTIADIFTGKITNWDDRRITADYGAQLPNQTITVVTRSDGSGASYMFTRWLSKEYPSDWNSFCAAHGGPSPCGPTEFYPGFANSVQKDGSDQMAEFLGSSISNGAIGYDEYAYALGYGLSAVKLRNAAGYYTLPTPSNVAVALEKAQINLDKNSVDYLMQDLDNVYTDSDPRAYPLSSYSYLVIPRTTGGGKNNEPPPSWTPAKGYTLSSFLKYVICPGQKEAGGLGYSPLPENLVQGAIDQVNNMPGHIAMPDRNTLVGCQGNPTYVNGVDTLTTGPLAPQPSPCDYYTEPLDCVIVGGKASAPATSNSGGGGSSNNGNGSGGNSANNGNATNPDNGNAANPAASHSLAAGGAAPKSSFDPNTGQEVGSGSNSSASAQSIDAEPVAVASRPDEESVLATLTVLEILAAVSAPVLVGAWIQRRRKRG
jgi:phosphate ABC transporter phosphate-binding protein